ncbi:MAG: bifunctional hydroxymethylpyrimidine kinase/phosphomethylpyrimidine kinase [Armatimonadetes bacterium]|nr:bifunctional hydroxymethylpyrimidine kinase/phosphomethylpyrimidine kinase [Armatimonadota bacterium]
MRRALTIGASDASAASGIQADLRVFARCGVYGTCAVALVAAQDTFTVRRVFRLASSIVGAQIDAAVADIGADAVKIGWYRSPELTTVIAGRLRRRTLKPVVLDPCLWSERGEALTPPRTVKRMVRELLPHVAVLTVTPRELGVFAGMPADEGPESVAAAIERVLALGVANVVVEDPRGAHAVSIGDASGIHAVAEWASPSPPAGEGALFSAALTAGLAVGQGLREAVRSAVAFMAAMPHTGEILPLGKGLPVWVPNILS